MSESTKTLHQAASTLKKNPGRVNDLVKQAAMRIVPAGQYASGRAKKIAEEAIKKLKAPRGLNGTDVSTKSTRFFKEASDKSKEVAKDAVITAGTAASGGALGYGIRSDLAKSRVTGHDNRKSFQAMKAGSPIEKNLVDSAKRVRRMQPAVGRLARRAGAVGALAGAALGVANGMNKKAAAPAVHKTVKVLPKGHPAVSAKDVSPKAVLKRRAGKAALAVGVAGLVASSAKHLQKKAEDKASVGSMAALGASAAALRRLGKDTKTGVIGLNKQMKHIASKGGHIRPINVRMAVDSLKKPIAKRVGKAALKGGAVGALAAAGLNKMMSKKADTVGDKGSREMKKVVESGGKSGSMAQMGGSDKKAVKSPVKGKNPLLKQAAEMIVRNGKKHRNGTPGSAAATFAGVNAGLQVMNNVSTNAGAAKLGLGSEVARLKLLNKVPAAAAGGAAVGYIYGKTRSHFRKKRGEHDTNPSTFRSLKKQAAEKMEHNGKTYRKGTVGSAAAKMGVLGAVSSALSQGKSKAAMNAINGLVGGGLVGGTYGLARKVLRHARGETSMKPSEFKEVKNIKRMKEIYGS